MVAILSRIAAPLSERLRQQRIEKLFRAERVEGGSGRKIAGPLPVITNQGAMRVGDGLSIRAMTVPVHLSTGRNGRLVLGDRVFLNTGAVVSAQAAIEIGDDCLIGDFAALYDSNFHQIGEGAAVTVKPVKLGRNVWLGRAVIVLPGAVIGDHSVIGAGSVVAREIPPGVLAAGNPVRVIREIPHSPAFKRR